MSRNPSARFSDLRALHDASERLSGRPTERAAPPTTRRERYTRFDLARLGPSSTDDGPRVARSSNPRPFGGPDFDALLAEARALAHAEVAFLVDAEGLVVASAGSVTGDEAQAIGARLLYALDQATHLAGESLALVAVATDSAWVSGARRRDFPGALTLGLVGPSVLGPLERAALEELLEEGDRAAGAPAVPIG